MAHCNIQYPLGMQHGNHTLIRFDLQTQMHDAKSELTGSIPQVHGLEHLIKPSSHSARSVFTEPPSPCALSSDESNIAERYYPLRD